MNASSVTPISSVANWLSSRPSRLWPSSRNTSATPPTINAISGSHFIPAPLSLLPIVDRAACRAAQRAHDAPPFSRLTLCSKPRFRQGCAGILCTARLPHRSRRPRRKAFRSRRSPRDCDQTDCHDTMVEKPFASRPRRPNSHAGLPTVTIAKAAMANNLAIWAQNPAIATAT